MDIALDRGQEDLAAARSLYTVHVGLEVGDRSFHHFGALQHLCHDELIGIEESAHLAHALHQRTVDDV